MADEVCPDCGADWAGSNCDECDARRAEQTAAADTGRKLAAILAPHCDEGESLTDCLAQILAEWEEACSAGADLAARAKRAEESALCHAADLRVIGEACSMTDVEYPLKAVMRTIRERAEALQARHDATARAEKAEADLSAAQGTISSLSTGWDEQRALTREAEERAERAERERDAARAEVASLRRELERWRHGQQIEGDAVCPDSLALTECRADRDALLMVARAALTVVDAAPRAMRWRGNVSEYGSPIDCLTARLSEPRVAALLATEAGATQPAQQPQTRCTDASRTSCAGCPDEPRCESPGREPRAEWGYLTMPWETVSEGSVPTHRCQSCGALWRHYPEAHAWVLISETCDACCRSDLAPVPNAGATEET